MSASISTILSAGVVPVAAVPAMATDAGAFANLMRQALVTSTADSGEPAESRVALGSPGNPLAAALADGDGSEGSLPQATGDSNGVANSGHRPQILSSLNARFAPATVEPATVAPATLAFDSEGHLASVPAQAANPATFTPSAPATVGVRGDKSATIWPSDRGGVRDASSSSTGAESAFLPEAAQNPAVVDAGVVADAPTPQELTTAAPLEQRTPAPTQRAASPLGAHASARTVPAAAAAAHESSFFASPVGAAGAQRLAVSNDATAAPAQGPAHAAAAAPVQETSTTKTPGALAPAPTTVAPAAQNLSATLTLPVETGPAPADPVRPGAPAPVEARFPTAVLQNGGLEAEAVSAPNLFPDASGRVRPELRPNAQRTSAAADTKGDLVAAAPATVQAATAAVAATAAAISPTPAAAPAVNPQPEQASPAQAVTAKAPTVQLVAPATQGASSQQPAVAPEPSTVPQEQRAPLRFGFEQASRADTLREVPVSAVAPVLAPVTVNPVPAVVQAIPVIEGQTQEAEATPSPAAPPVGVAPLVASTPTAAAPAAQQLPTIPAHAAFTAQVAKPIFTLATTAAPGEHIMVIKVTPDNLGPVTVQAHINGSDVRIELFAPNDAGRDALRAVLPDLKRDIAGSGLQTQLNLSSGNHPGAQQGDSGRNASTQREYSANQGATSGRQLPMDATTSTARAGLSGTDAAVLDVMA